MSQSRTTSTVEAYRFFFGKLCRSTINMNQDQLDAFLRSQDIRQLFIQQFNEIILSVYIKNYHPDQSIGKDFSLARFDSRLVSNSILPEATKSKRLLHLLDFILAVYQIKRLSKSIVEFKNYALISDITDYVEVNAHVINNSGIAGFSRREGMAELFRECPIFAELVNNSPAPTSTAQTNHITMLTELLHIPAHTCQIKAAADQTLIEFGSSPLTETEKERAIRELQQLNISISQASTFFICANKPYDEFISLLEQSNPLITTSPNIQETNLMSFWRQDYVVKPERQDTQAFNAYIEPNALNDLDDNKLYQPSR